MPTEHDLTVAHLFSLNTAHIVNMPKLGSRHIWSLQRLPAPEAWTAFVYKMLSGLQWIGIEPSSYTVPLLWSVMMCKPLACFVSLSWLCLFYFINLLIDWLVRPFSPWSFYVIASIFYFMYSCTPSIALDSSLLGNSRHWKECEVNS